MLKSSVTNSENWLALSALLMHKSLWENSKKKFANAFYTVRTLDFTNIEISATILSDRVAPLFEASDFRVTVGGKSIFR